MRFATMAWLVLAVAGGDALAQEAWTAKWIQAPWSTVRDGAEADGSRPMPIFRHEFDVQGKVTHAEFRIAGLGQYSLQIDGRSATPPGLHQAWTDYRKTVTYETYDVTAQLQPGTHVLGVMLGNGLYNVQKSVMANGKQRYTKLEGSFGPPKLIGELRLTYSGGRMQTIATDGTWKTSHGPVVFTSAYGGEDFDARKMPDGWTAAGFEDTSWTTAQVVGGPGGKLVRALAPEVGEMEVHAAVNVTELAPNRTVYDLGQNFAGVPRIRARGPAGAVLRLTPGELLNADGSVSQRSSGGPMWWTYTLRGSTDIEVWQPQFSYYGFRYLQAEWVGADARPATASLDKVEGIALHTSAKVTGSFASSNPMLNAIHKLILESMHNNEVSLFTDCPHREKLGWLEETHLVAPGLMFNNDLRGLYAASSRNMADAQHADGDVPTTAPQYTTFGGQNSPFDDSPEWGSASVLAPWAAYRFYGDKVPLAENYNVMQKYVAYLELGAKSGIVTYGLGDWYDIGPKPPGVSQLTSLGVTGTLMLYEDAADLAKIAALLGKQADATKYAALARHERDAFNATYWNAAQGVYDKGSQTAQAMPLALGLVPLDRRAALIEKLIADIHAHDDHVTTGEIGYPYLVRVLTDAGRSDVLLAMMLRKDPPSYGSQLAAGATALTEAWDASPRSSQDHFMLGGGEAWFFRGLGGIDFDMSREKPEERITIRPAVYGMSAVDWVKASYASVLGDIQTEWHVAHAIVTVTVSIPQRSHATVLLPEAVETNGHGKVIAKGNPTTDGLRRFVVGPGRHTFEATVLQL